MFPSTTLQLIPLLINRCEPWLFSFLIFPRSFFPHCESDFEKDENVDVKEESNPIAVSSGYPFWISEQNGSHAFTAASPAPADQREGPAREQQVPTPSYQTYR